MQLITKEILARLPKIGDTSNDADPMIQVKFFYPDFGWTWYMTEYDPKTEDCFGFVDGDFPELGYFSLAELKANHGKLGCPIERDYYFEPIKLSELRKKIGR